MENKETALAKAQDIGELVEAGRTRKASKEIAKLNSEELSVLVSIANDVGMALYGFSKETVAFIKDAYRAEMASQHAMEMENIAQEREITRQFNHLVGKLEDKLDLNNPDSIESFRQYNKELRTNYSTQMDDVDRRRDKQRKVGLFGRLFNKD